MKQKFTLALLCTMMFTLGACSKPAESSVAPTSSAPASSVAPASSETPASSEAPASSETPVSSEEETGYKDTQENYVAAIKNTLNADSLCLKTYSDDILGEVTYYSTDYSVRENYTNDIGKPNGILRSVESKAITDKGKTILYGDDYDSLIEYEWEFKDMFFYDEDGNPYNPTKEDLEADMKNDMLYLILGLCMRDDCFYSDMTYVEDGKYTCDKMYFEEGYEFHAELHIEDGYLSYFKAFNDYNSTYAEISVNVDIPETHEHAHVYDDDNDPDCNICNKRRYVDFVGKTYFFTFDYTLSRELTDSDYDISFYVDNKIDYTYTFNADGTVTTTIWGETLPGEYTWAQEGSSLTISETGYGETEHFTIGEDTLYYEKNMTISVTTTYRLEELDTTPLYTLDGKSFSFSGNINNAFETVDDSIALEDYNTISIAFSENTDGTLSATMIENTSAYGGEVTTNGNLVYFTYEMDGWDYTKTFYYDDLNEVLYTEEMDLNTSATATARVYSVLLEA